MSDRLARTHKHPSRKLLQISKRLAKIATNNLQLELSEDFAWHSSTLGHDWWASKTSGNAWLKHLTYASEVAESCAYEGLVTA